MEELAQFRKLTCVPLLASTRLIEPGQSFTIQFRAPVQAGDYPFVCTFPGHWRVMNGVLTVTGGRASEP